MKIGVDPKLYSIHVRIMCMEEFITSFALEGKTNAGNELSICWWKRENIQI